MISRSHAIFKVQKSKRKRKAYVAGAIMSQTVRGILQGHQTMHNGFSHKRKDRSNGLAFSDSLYVESYRDYRRVPVQRNVIDTSVQKHFNAQHVQNMSRLLDAVELANSWSQADLKGLKYVSHIRLFREYNSIGTCGSVGSI